MLYSEQELGVGIDAGGIIDLGAECVPGQRLIDAFPELDDVVVEIDNKSLTHRPDLWGHLGFARECSVIFSKPMRDIRDAGWMSKMKALFPGGSSPVQVKLEGESACLGFCGISVDGVTVAPSPRIIQRRLMFVGLRPINNLVDIGNYVMLELGLPLHMYDRDLIQGGAILVHALEAKAELGMLDGSVSHLIPGDTVVADNRGPLVVAGIMGGAQSGINDNTKRVFIEVANWKPASVRHTGKRLGLRTDSSMRYEKSLDTSGLAKTALRALEMLQELCPGAKALGEFEQVYADPKMGRTPEITVPHKRIESALGRAVESQEIVRILQGLGFSVTSASGTYNITVPTYRATKDISGEADIVEEIGRLIGYNSIPPQAPVQALAPVRLTKTKRLHRKIQDFFVLQARAVEAFTYPLVGEKLLSLAGWPTKNEALVLANPMSPETDRMRPSLVPSLLEAAALNQKTYETFRLFEIGRSYISSGDFCDERFHLGALLFNREENCFIQALDLVEHLLADLRSRPWSFTPAQHGLIPRSWSGTHPNFSREIVVQGVNIGTITQVAPNMLRNFKIRGELTILIIDATTLEPLCDEPRNLYQPISRFPSSLFDCTVVTPPRIEAEAVLNIVRGLGEQHIADVKILTVYPLDDGKNAVTIRCTFLDRERTLSGDEIKGLETAVLGSLERSGFPLRQ